MISAARGDGVDRLLDLVGKAAEQHRKRIPTAQLNRFFAEVIEEMPPPLHKGKAIRINYITQAVTRPPTFVLWASAAQGLAQSYKRMHLEPTTRSLWLSAARRSGSSSKKKKDRHDRQELEEAPTRAAARGRSS